MHNALKWDEEFCYETTIEVLTDLGTTHCNAIANQPLKDALKQALASGSWRHIVDWELPLSAGTLSASDILEARQVLGFFQKLEPLKLGLNKEEVARKSFLMAESKCRETNETFRLWSQGKFNFPKGVSGILHSAARKIQKVLGPVPALSELGLRFGPGATTSVQKRNACQRIKLSAVPSCSANFVQLLPSFFREVPAWRENLVTRFSVDGEELVEQFDVDIHHGRLAFVTKNAKTYRSVMTGPTCNGMLQAGYGDYIAKRLLRVGQDIHDQTRNQKLARRGSLARDLATLDLSNASNTISIELVSHLLPDEWFSALNSCRVPTVIDKDEGNPILLEQFSSMGNGFTFPLQTLIFWALVSASQDSEVDVSVYGDDIICPLKHLPEIFQVFDVCGFILNKEKSFWEGPFRESCGADYYFGISVRPFYVKKLLSFERLFALHNFYVRAFDDERAATVLGYIPNGIRLWGPDGYGDGHLVGDCTLRHHKREHGWGGWLFDTFTKIGRAHTRVLPGDRVFPAYSIYTSEGERPNIGHVLRPVSESPMESKKNKRGVVRHTLPGVIGYKQTQIYTLTPY